MVWEGLRGDEEQAACTVGGVPLGPRERAFQVRSKVGVQAVQAHIAVAVERDHRGRGACAGRALDALHG